MSLRGFSVPSPLRKPRVFLCICLFALRVDFCPVLHSLGVSLQCVLLFCMSISARKHVLGYPIESIETGLLVTVLLKARRDFEY